MLRQLSVCVCVCGRPRPVKLGHVLLPGFPSDVTLAALSELSDEASR